ncbi:MAG: hypothetical protein KKD18_03930 [Nanoarchaeota archaeon]|nr:hypothetical protein [Nanoarchaeota archaeon]MBU0977541.1 hypothetical protein [Nanoarchaeota archaeon]
MNKKAAAAIAATWLIATFIIFFLCITFLAGVIALEGKYQVWNSVSGINVNEEKSKADLIINKNIESTLNKNIIIDNKKILLSEAISATSEDALAQTFKDTFEPSFNKIFPPKPSATPSWWIRVYNKGEQLTLTKKLTAGGTLCDPQNEQNLVTSFFIGDKVLVFCLEGDYYGGWRNNKYA